VKSLAVLLLTLAAGASPALAQSPPPGRPLNPIATSRSGLGYVPYLPFDLTRNRWSLSFEYGNAIDFDQRGAASYLLDAELMRTSVAWTRDLSPRLWLSVEGEIVGSYDGFADGFVVWYHRQIRFVQPERDARPKNVYGFEIALPDGTRVAPEQTGLALGDARATIARRHDAFQQTALTVTFPTATGSGGFGRGVPSLNLTHAMRIDLANPLFWEISAGAGYTPKHGALRAYQHTVFAMGTTGVRIHLWGGQSIYGYFFYHTPYYRGTTLNSLDNHELTGDFGWLIHSKGGNEWRIGMTEDLGPGDPGIDLVFKASGTW
jgi:hypothetical protein